MKLAIIETKASLDQWREDVAPKRVAFVPTMGALHAGHMSLVKQAKALADVVIVSIFVNPTQFGPNEDFAKYPRTIEEDIEKLRQAGINALFLPDVKTIYPDSFSTTITVSGLSERWCGASRPGHFDGVATVVARLFGLVKPHIAIFGEKDFQQLAIIKRMNEDLALGIEIIGAPVMREADGLALSSRNRFLTNEQRMIAPRLYAALLTLRNELSANPVANPESLLEKYRSEILNAGFNKLDYLVLVDSKTLEPIQKLYTPARILVAAWLGNTRLIDNIEAA